MPKHIFIKLEWSLSTPVAANSIFALMCNTVVEEYKIIFGFSVNLI